MANKGEIQVRFTLDPDLWHGTASEGIWTQLVMALADKAIVEVDNIPFFSKGVSLGDKIAIVFRDGQVVFDSIVERSGHSTYRVFLNNQQDSTERLVRALKDFGCDWERTDFRGGNLFAVDVPPKTNIYDVYEFLEDGENDELWMFEEGHVGHSLRGDSTSPSM